MDPSRRRTLIVGLEPTLAADAGDVVEPVRRNEQNMRVEILERRLHWIAAHVEGIEVFFYFGNIRRTTHASGNGGTLLNKHDGGDESTQENAFCEFLHTHTNRGAQHPRLLPELLGFHRRLVREIRLRP